MPCHHKSYCENVLPFSPITQATMASGSIVTFYSPVCVNCIYCLRRRTYYIAITLETGMRCCQLPLLDGLEIIPLVSFYYVINQSVYTLSTGFSNFFSPQLVAQCLWITSARERYFTRKGIFQVTWLILPYLEHNAYFHKLVYSYWANRWWSRWDTTTRML
jgi:hypothetical protein